MPTLICNCNDTMPLDGAALGAEPLKVHRLLCRREIGDFRQALDGTDDVIVACTQESPLFTEVVAQTAREHGVVTAPVRFVNIRETGGWSAGARRDPATANAKIAALLAVAALPDPDPVAIVDYRSEGAVLVMGPAARALPWAGRLSEAGLDVTVLLGGSDSTMGAVGSDVIPAGRAWPVHSGTLKSLGGWLGAFTATWETGAGKSNPIDLDLCTRCNACIAACPEQAIDFSYQINLDRCRDHRECVKACGAAAAIDFDRPVSTETGRFDIVFDLNDSPAFKMHQPPQGYLHAGGDVAHQYALALTVQQLVGEFEKPKFFRYKESLCAHGRNQTTGCTACIDICSTQAISSRWRDGKGHIEVTPNLCMGCGACTTVCPSGAISYGYPGPETLGERLRTLVTTYNRAGGRDAVLLLHGEEHGTPAILGLGRAARAGQVRGVPPNVIPVSVFHPASTGIELWLAALCWGAGGVAVLLTGDEAPQYRAALIEQMAVARAILGGLGYRGQRLALVEAHDAATLDAGLAAISAPAEPVTPLPAAAFRAALAKRETLDFVIDHLARHAPAPAETVPLPKGAPLGAVEVETGRCTLCMACVGACPSQALRDNPERPVLAFIERNCVQCGLCEKTCPEDAITLVPRLLAGDAARRPVTLNETRPFHCIRCGKPFGTEQMVESMLVRLAGHPAFAGAAAERLKMCGDCRIVDMMEKDNGAATGATLQ